MAGSVCHVYVFSVSTESDTAEPADECRPTHHAVIASEPSNIDSLNKHCFLLDECFSQTKQLLKMLFADQTKRISITSIWLNNS